MINEYLRLRIWLTCDKNELLVINNQWLRLVSGWLAFQYAHKEIHMGVINQTCACLIYASFILD